MEHAIYATPSDRFSNTRTRSPFSEALAPKPAYLAPLPACAQAPARNDAVGPKPSAVVGIVRSKTVRAFMRVVPILPDELLVGYRGRLGALNNCATAGEIHQLVSAAFGAGAQTSNGDARFLAGASAATGKSIDTLLGQHTMWPLFTSFPYDDAALADRPARALSFAGVCLRPWRSHLAYCADCVRHDLATFYFSYWRRSHQVPGLFHCPVHGSELRLVDKELISRRPDEIQTAAPSEHPLAAVALTPAASVATAILTRIIGGARTEFLALVQDRLRNSAFRTLGVDRVAEVISELVRRIHGDELCGWLSDLMPFTSSECAREEGFLWRVLSPSSRAASAASVAFTASLIDRADGFKAVFGDAAPSTGW